MKQEKKQSTGIFKKSNKKKNGRRADDEISEVTDEYNSNFTFSDSIDISKESDLISEFRTQTRMLRTYENVEESEIDDDFSSVSGSVTQRHRYNLFDSSDSENGDGPEESAVNSEERSRVNKFKRLLDSSDEDDESSKNTNSISVNKSSNKSSGTVKMEFEDSESEMSQQMKGKAKTGGRPQRKKTRSKRHEIYKEEESDSWSSFIVINHILSIKLT